MSAASTSIDDDGGSTTSSDGGGYIGVPVGQKQFPNQPHVGGKTIGGKTLVGGKTFKSMGETSTDNDSDEDDEGQVAFEGGNNDGEQDLGVEEEGEPSDDQETEDENDIPHRTLSPPQAHKPQVAAPIPVHGEQQSQLEAWKEVHASLTRAVLVAREAIASKKLQRRFWLETICGNLAHPSEVKTTNLPGVAPSDAPPSQMPLLLPHSIWYKPDQRKKKRGSKKQSVGSEEASKPKKPSKKKAAAVHNKTTLASLSKKIPAKGASTLKKRKQLLPLKAKKKRAATALPTKTSKAKVSVSVDTSKVLPPEAKSAAAVLSIFADDSDDDSDEIPVAMAVEADDNDDSDDDVAIAEEDEKEESKPTFTLHTFDSDDSSSEDEDDNEKLPGAKVESEHGPDNDNSSDDNNGPDWNASQQSHPFLKKRRSSINSTTQGNLTSSEIYSTFRPDNEEQKENKQDEGEENRGTPSSRMMGNMSGYGPFGGSDTSDDEIPF